MLVSILLCLLYLITYPRSIIVQCPRIFILNIWIIIIHVLYIALIMYTYVKEFNTFLSPDNTKHYCIVVVVVHK